MEGDVALCGGSRDHTGGFGSVAGSLLREIETAVAQPVSEDIANE